MKNLPAPCAVRLALGLAVLDAVSLPRANACEPIFPLAAVFAGPNFFAQISGVALTLGCLGVAVGVKCAAFAWLERQLRWHEAVGFMLLANVLTSLVGLLVAGFASVPPLMLIGLPGVYFLSLTPARRLLAYATWAKPASRVKPRVLALAFPVGLILTWFLFGWAGLMLYQQSYLAYWLLKFGYLSVALFISILLTASWEESIVAQLALRRHGEGSYLATVVRANYITFGVILLTTALVMLPKRLHSRGFLAWLGRLTDWIQG